MKWLTLVFVIVTLGAIAILLYKVMSQILSYKLDNRIKNPTVRKWCTLHNRYFLDGTICPRCRHFESMENRI